VGAEGDEVGKEGKGAADHAGYEVQADAVSGSWG
jgi:hypothetical protein